MSKEDDCDSGLQGWANLNFNEVEMGERIGGGGVGIIYKGWYRDEPVALKTLFDARISQDLKQEYMDELLVMSKVQHSNIVKFMGACMTPPNLCFLMELCDGSLFNMMHVQKHQFSMLEKIQLLVSAYVFVYSLCLLVTLPLFACDTDRCRKRDGVLAFDQSSNYPPRPEIPQHSSSQQWCF